MSYRNSLEYIYDARNALRHESGIYDCSVCREENIHPYESARHIVGGEDVCQSCVAMCPQCGEYIEDASEHLGPAVRFREWCNDGKLGEPHHASCAADWLLGEMAEVKDFYEGDYSREHIAALFSATAAVKAGAR